MELKKHIHRRARGIINRAAVTTTFLHEFLKAPFCVGSVCPSSGYLTSALVASVPITGDGMIIDLGAGSGIVSENLLRAGVSPERILAVELLPAFNETFSRRCPGIPFIVGDARNLGNILHQHAPGTKLCAVVSSLPFRVMPPGVVREILQELKNVMRDRHGTLIQYTYALWMRYPLKRFGFSPCSSSVVLRNLPPARVEAYAI